VFTRPISLLLLGITAILFINVSPHYPYYTYYTPQIAFFQ
jgi:hypothetical protein